MANIEVCKTPAGQECVKIYEKEVIAAMEKQCRGCFQRAVLRELLVEGYIRNNYPTGVALKGKAAGYSSRYSESVYNLMQRLDKVLRPLGLGIEGDSVGPRGGWGYYIARRE
jgi:hypothetical protein